MSGNSFVNGQLKLTSLSTACFVAGVYLDYFIDSSDSESEALALRAGFSLSQRLNYRKLLVRNRVLYRRLNQSFTRTATFSNITNTKL